MWAPTFLSLPDDECAPVAFYERGESRKNFAHAGGMKDSFDRQREFTVLAVVRPRARRSLRRWRGAIRRRAPVARS